MFYINKPEAKTNSLKFVTTSSRVMSQSNIEALRADLLSTDWFFIDEAYDSFLNKFNALLDINIPIVRKTFKTYSKDHKPWITSGIKNSICRKSSLYRVLLQKKTPEAREKYKSYKNKLINTIRISERQYFQNKFEVAKGNIKKTWSILKLS